LADRGKRNVTNQAKLPPGIPSGGFLGKKRMNPRVACNDNIEPIKLLSFRELNTTRGISFSRRYLHTLEAQKKFPARVPLGEHRVAWVAAEIDTWLADKLAARAA
jgi:prophage regulatory protein